LCFIPPVQGERGQTDGKNTGVSKTKRGEKTRGRGGGLGKTSNSAGVCGKIIE